MRKAAAFVGVALATMAFVFLTGRLFQAGIVAVGRCF
jgi:hypothetical protein